MTGMAAKTGITSNSGLFRTVAAFALAYLAIAAPLLMGVVLPHLGAALLNVGVALPRGEVVPMGMALPSLLLGSALVLLSAIDCRTFRLPDVLTLPLAGAGLLVAFLRDPDLLAWHAGSAALGGLALAGVALLYRRLRGRDGLGLGDTKLFAAAGAWTGAEGLASVLLVACVSALAAVLVRNARGAGLDRASAVPFGPFIALGLWAVWLFGPLV